MNRFLAKCMDPPQVRKGIGLLVLVAAMPMAHAGGSLASATLPEQIVQETTLAESYTEQVTQTAQQIQMVANQVRNLASLPAQTWNSVVGNLQQLITLVGNAQGLSFAAQNSLAAIQQQYGSPDTVLGNYSQALNQWNSNLNSQISSSLQQFGLSASNFATTQQAIASLQAQSQSATGRMKVLQAGNQIAGYMVNEMQGLHADLIAANQATMNYEAMQANAKTQDNNAIVLWQHNTYIPPQ